MSSPKFEPSKPKNNHVNRFISLPCKNPTSKFSEADFIDLPPDSFWVSKGDENDWFERNAILQRTSSRKLSFSGSPTHHFHQENLFTPHRSSISFNYISSKIPFIVLPVGHRQKSFPAVGVHRKNYKAAESSAAYFKRSRSEARGKLAMQATEPTSPQVNCLGRVGTKKEKVKKTGVWWQSIAAFLKTGFNNNLHSVACPVSDSNTEVKKERNGPVDEEKFQKTNLPGLMRLTSGRRSCETFGLKDE